MLSAVSAIYFMNTTRLFVAQGREDSKAIAVNEITEQLFECTYYLDQIEVRKNVSSNKLKLEKCLLEAKKHKSLYVNEVAGKLISNRTTSQHLSIAFVLYMTSFVKSSCVKDVQALNSYGLIEMYLYTRKRDVWPWKFSDSGIHLNYDGPPLSTVGNWPLSNLWENLQSSHLEKYYEVD